MAKNEEFDLDFDFEKEYGIDPNTLIDQAYDGADLDLSDDFLNSDDLASLLNFDTEALSQPAPADESAEEAPAWEEPAPVWEESKTDWAQPEQNQEASEPDWQQLAQDWTQPEQEPQQPEQNEEPVPQEPDPQEPAPQEQPVRRRRPRYQSSLAEDPGESAQTAAQPAQELEQPAVPQRRRRKKSKQQVFKENYLPLIIAGVAAVMMLVFIIGSVSRTIRTNRAEEESSLNASIAAESEAQRQDDEADRIISEAAALAAGYDYEAAIALLDSFSGEITAYPEMVTAKSSYSKQLSQLTKWDDPADVTNLSFHVLIADPSRAFIAEEFGRSYNKNFVTIDEFSKILERLYNNGYVLVDLDDIVTTTTAEDGTVSFVANAIYLPEGKKPIMLTETLVNYFNYMIDSDGDKLPDAGGSGFASRLVLQNGEIKAEMVDGNGNTVVGDYDLVPILNSFIEEHPDFSYRGARALLGVCGYDGIFGYRIQDGEAEEIDGAKQIVQALRNDGYTIACYSYENINYGANNQNAASIKADLESWKEDIEPVLGAVDVMIFAGGGDLGDYSGNKYEVLYEYGFRYFIGAATEPWAQVHSTYFRQKRLMVTGTQMAYGSSIFNDYFSSMSILNELRGTVPN